MVFSDLYRTEYLSLGYNRLLEIAGNTEINITANQFSIQPHLTYLSTSKICRVELCTELFYAIIPTLFLCYHSYLVSMLFADLLAIPTSCNIFNVFILVDVPFFSSRCMLELKFAINYRAASLPSQACYAVLAEESQAFFKHSPHTNSISNSAFLPNNYISLLSNLCACVHVKKKWRRKGSHSSSVSGSKSPRVTSNLEKRDGLVHCSVKNAVLCENHREIVTQI